MHCDGGRVKIPFLKNTIALCQEQQTCHRAKLIRFTLSHRHKWFYVYARQFYAQRVSCFPLELWSLQLWPSHLKLWPSHLMPPVALHGSWVATLQLSSGCSWTKSTWKCSKIQNQKYQKIPKSTFTSHYSSCPPSLELFERNALCL